MKFVSKVLVGLILLTPFVCYGQEITSKNADNNERDQRQIYGFVRGGLYSGFDKSNHNKPYASSVFSDFALKADVENGLNFRAFADLRFRYGVEFQEPVNRFDLREAYVKVNGKKWDISAGQKIVKWGRTDFTHPTSKLSSQNLLSRSPDRADMDMGNLLSSFKLYPSDIISFEAVVIPFYRSSVLIIDQVPLPQNVTINEINSLVTGKKMLSYGLRTDFHMHLIDWGISWFDGYDPIPGISLTRFSLDMSGPIPLPETELTFTPYKTRVLGFDYEMVAGDFGIRGEAAWSVPYISYKSSEFVPWPEINWVTGVDWSSGLWRIIAEYSGKNIQDFTPSAVDPLIGTDPDYSELAQLFMIPGFDPENYIRQQVGAFNRLYNYQLKRYYHSAGIRVESELRYGMLIPSIFALYNFTTRDLLVVPELKYKPADGLTITAGAEIYSGPKGSLYDIVEGFMNSIYLSLRVDF